CGRRTRWQLPTTSPIPAIDWCSTPVVTGDRRSSTCTATSWEVGGSTGRPGESGSAVLRAWALGPFGGEPGAVPLGRLERRPVGPVKRRETGDAQGFPGRRTATSVTPAGARPSGCGRNEG